MSILSFSMTQLSGDDRFYEVGLAPAGWHDFLAHPHDFFVAQRLATEVQLDHRFVMVFMSRGNGASSLTLIAPEDLNYAADTIVVSGLKQEGLMFVETGTTTDVMRQSPNPPDTDNLTVLIRRNTAATKTVSFHIEAGTRQIAAFLLSLAVTDPTELVDRMNRMTVLSEIRKSTGTGYDQEVFLPGLKPRFKAPIGPLVASAEGTSTGLCSCYIGRAQLSAPDPTQPPGPLYQLTSAGTKSSIMNCPQFPTFQAANDGVSQDGS
jgi:hypothetical protein